MVQRTPGRDAGEVAACFRRWVGVIRLFAEKDADRRQLVEDDYRTLHVKLLNACRTAASSGEANDEQQQLLRELQDLAGPWVSLESLQQAPPKIMQDLLGRSEFCQEKLGVRTSAWAGPQGWQVFLGVFCVGFLLTVLVLLGQSTDSWQVLGTRFGSVLEVVGDGLNTVRKAPLVWPLGAAVCGALSLLAYLVFYSPRSY